MEISAPPTSLRNLPLVIEILHQKIKEKNLDHDTNVR